jgi:hypothetical protein
MPQVISRAPSRTKLPCTPGASSLTVLLTRDLQKITYRYFVVGAFFALVLMPILSGQVDEALRWIGYGDDFVSSFPFIRSLYSHFLSAGLIGHEALGYFHILDAVLWTSIGVWGTWLFLGILFLPQYDDYFRYASEVLSGKYRDQQALILLGWPLLALSAAFITYVSTQEKILNDFEFEFLLAHLPGAYFYLLALIYYYTGFLVALGLFFLIWKLCRQGMLRELFSRRKNLRSTSNDG